MRTYGASRLGRPTVIFGPGAIQLGPHISVAPSRRVQPKSSLRPPVVVNAVVVLPRPVDVSLARRVAGRSSSILKRPALIGAGVVLGPVELHLSPSQRGRATSDLRPPGIVAAAAPLARPIDVSLARRNGGRTSPRLNRPALIGAGIVFQQLRVELTYSRRGRASSVLRAPGVVTPAVAAALVTSALVRLVRARPRPTATWLHGPVVVLPFGFVQIGPPVILAPKPRATTRSLLRPPTVVAVVVPLARPLDISLSAARRPTSKSRLSVPAAVGGPIAFHGPGVNLAWRANYRQPVRHVLAAPAVVLAATLAPITVSLAPSRRGKPSARLAPPPIGASFVAPRSPVRLAPLPTQARVTRRELSPPSIVGASTAFHGPGVRLVTPITTRQPVRHVLAPPAVVVSNAPFAPIQATLTYSRRGLAKPSLSPPTTIGVPVVFHGPGVRLTAPANSRAPVRHLLQPPAVVVSIAPFAPLTVILAYSRRGAPVSRLTAPRIVGAAVAFHGPGVRLVAPSDRRAPVAHRLAAPTLVTPAAFTTPATSALAPSRVTRARGSRLAPPTLISGAITFHGPGVKLTAPRSTRPPVRARLVPPAVVTPVAPHAPARVTLTRSSRGRPTSILSPPAATGGAVIYRGPGVRLTIPANSRRPVRHALAPPTVITPIAVAYHGPGVRVASINNTRRPVAHRLSPPTVLATPYRFHGPGVRLTTPLTTRRPVRHVLAPPTVVNPFPIAYRGPGVKLVAPINTRAAVRHALLYPPAVIGGAVVYHGPRVRLVTPINARAPVRYRLAAPTLVTPAEAYYGPLLTLAPASRGAPASTLSAPAVVGAGVAHHGPRVKLTPLLNRRAPLRGYRLAPPTVVQPLTLIFFGPLVALAPPSSGKPLSQLAAPAVVGAGVTFRAVKVTLAPSLRGTAKPNLAPPTVVGTVAFRSITVTLTPSRRVRTRSLLRQPAAVRLQPFRPITVQTARIRPARVHSTLRAALLPPPNASQRTLRVELAQPTRRRTISTLAPPALIGGGIVYRPVQTHLARNVHPPVNRMLGAPTVIILISACHGYAGDHAPNHGYIIDTSECAAGETGDHTDAGGMIQDTSEDGGYAGDHPQAGGYVTDTGG